jgi:hypothetical protein
MLELRRVRQPSNKGSFRPNRPVENGLARTSRNPHDYSARTGQTAPQPNPILVDKNGSCPAASVFALASQATLALASLSA